jgi:hypothetical protein
MKLKVSKLILAAFFFGMFSSTVHANTDARQLQLNGGLGVFVGTEGLDASFDFSIEPEYFITEHNSVSFRFDVTVGSLDSVQFSARYRYYFDIPRHPKINIFVGAGFGGGTSFGGRGFGDFAIPVFGWQYDVTHHFKVGSDVSFDIFFTSNNAAFATRLMPVVLKYAF